MAETILGIDTSCDDTSIAAVAAKIANPKSQIPNFKILSNVVSSQVKLHAKYGGVYPTLAKREHQRNLPLVLKRALKKAELLQIQSSKSKIQSKLKIQNPKQKPQIKAIAVTVGPGLEPCLWQGINFAIDLAKKWQLSIIPVNHLEAHLLAALAWPCHSETEQSEGEESPEAECRRFFGSLRSPQNDTKKQFFPALGLVVSGGNTQLVLVKKIGQYKILGETRDDAAGECLDKTARILGLPYPGGPAIARQAEQWKSQLPNPKSQINPKSQLPNKFKINLPRPMLYSQDYDFSFSGLKTAVLYDYKKRSPILRKSKKYIQAMAQEIQQAIIDVLLKKTLRAAQAYQVKSILLGGGVACNTALRQKLKMQTEKIKVNFSVPPKKLCLDNAAMIALTGFFHQNQATKNWDKLEANGNLKIS